MGLGQTEITSPIFTLRSVIDYYNKRGSTVGPKFVHVRRNLKHLIKLIVIVCLLN